MSLNGWMYVAGNPVNFVDPTRHIISTEICEDWGECFSMRKGSTPPSPPPPPPPPEPPRKPPVEDDPPGVDVPTPNLYDFGPLGTIANQLAQGDMNPQCMMGAVRDFCDQNPNAPWCMGRGGGSGIGGGGGGPEVGSGTGYIPPDIPDWVPDWIADDLHNVDMALFIINHPDASFGQKYAAAFYLNTWGFAAAAGVTGAALLGYAGYQAISAGATAACADGDCTNEVVTVYRYVENGVTRYIGITNDMIRRAGEHLRASGWRIEEIQNLGELTRLEARAVEQILLEYYGLANLYNQINSIAQTNPIYQWAIHSGAQILDNSGFMP